MQKKSGHDSRRTVDEDNPERKSSDLTDRVASPFRGPNLSNKNVSETVAIEVAIAGT